MHVMLEQSRAVTLSGGDEDDVFSSLQAQPISKY